MAKYLLFTDNHFCEVSSIVRKYGTKYSCRLENQIQSLNWVEEQAKLNNCDAVICLGDFFNSPSLNDMELTALQDIKWANEILHYFIVGNHESEDLDLRCNSAKALESFNRKIISTPSSFKVDNTVELCFLPYIKESDRKTISEYFGPKTSKRIILSHNDLSGIQLGPVMTQVGFELPDIENNCDLFINGHLHNGEKITNKIINLGNLTGQDFKEDALRYKHRIIILDTETFTINYLQNPFAFNFYKFDLKTEQDLAVLNKIKESNPVVSIKCEESLYQVVLERLNSIQNLVESRLMRYTSCTNENGAEADLKALGVTDDYLTKFYKFCELKFEMNDILKYELGELCK